MNEEDVRSEYARIWAAVRRSDRIGKLRNLRNAAGSVGFDHWCILIDARLASLEERLDAAIKLSAVLIGQSECSEEIHRRARVIRGLAYQQQGKLEEAIADCTAVIDDPASLPEQKAWVRSGRGMVYRQQGKLAEAIADCTAVIDDPALTPEQKAWARVIRGMVYQQQGKLEEAIADHTAVIDDPASPPEQKAWVRIGRAITHGQQGNLEKLAEAIADHTAVIDDPALTPEQKAWARSGRGMIHGQQGKLAEAIADCTAVIDDPASTSAAQTARLLLEIYRDASERKSPIVTDLTVELDSETREAFKKELVEGRKRKRDFFGESQFRADVSFLLVAREWNSYTPAVPGQGEPSRGGGYFIKHAGTGIVVDPGFDFLEIFSEAGGRLCDIDCIVVTHAHNDHTAELEAILTLKYEYYDAHKDDPAPKKKVDLYLSQGAARKFAGLLPLRDCLYIGEIVTLNRGKSENPQVAWLSKEVSLTVLPANHDDIITRDYAVGLGFAFHFKDGTPRRLLFTGDTAVFPQGDAKDSRSIHMSYPAPFCNQGIDLVVAHIGSIEDFELEGPLGTMTGEERSFTPRGTYTKHLGLIGTFSVLSSLRPKAAIISEFGEEMKTIWIKAVRAIGKKLEAVAGEEPTPPVFAGDPVTIYEIGTGQFLCHEDMKFHNGGDLMMLGVHEPRKGREAWPVRPYLFLKTGSKFEDESDREDRVTAFHDAVRGRKELPYFLASTSRRK